MDELLNIPSVRREIEAGASCTVIDGVPVLFYGNLPSSPSVLISSFSISSEATARELYISALEASLDGYQVVSEAYDEGSYSVLRGTEDGGGHLHLVLSSPLSFFRTRHNARMRRILHSGGSVMSTALPSARDAAIWLSSRLSDAAVAAVGCSETPLRLMADEGKDTAILRSSLATLPGRRLAAEGCPVVDSFSAFRFQPSSIVHPDPSGPWSFLGVRYGRMRLC